MQDLVVKITDICNFKCDFCSSNNISDKPRILDIEVLKKYLLENDVNCIIMNGGDPLMVPSSYYMELIKFIEDNDLETTISITSNLMKFYENPTEWIDILKHPLVWTCTSFQFGTQRKLQDGTIYTVSMFKKVYDLYTSLIGKSLPFIAVIDEENEDTVLTTVTLAKDTLNTVCRCNPKLRSGRATTHYPYHKMFAKYLDVIEQGYGDYEMNCKLIKKAWNGNLQECPYTRNCSGVKCMNPDGSVTTCASISDDLLTNKMPEYFRGNEEKIPYDLTCLTEECYTCKFFNICCSCHKRIQDIKDSNTVQEHCEGMKALLERAEEVLCEKEKNY